MLLSWRELTGSRYKTLRDGDERDAVLIGSEFLVRLELRVDWGVTDRRRVLRIGFRTAAVSAQRLTSYVLGAMGMPCLGVVSTCCGEGVCSSVLVMHPSNAEVGN